jgi:hypothetical protein
MALQLSPPRYARTAVWESRPGEHPRGPPVAAIVLLPSAQRDPLNISTIRTFRDDSLMPRRRCVDLSCDRFHDNVYVPVAAFALVALAPIRLVFAACKRFPCTGFSQMSRPLRRTLRVPGVLNRQTREYSNPSRLLRQWPGISYSSGLASGL